LSVRTLHTSSRKESYDNNNNIIVIIIALHLAIPPSCIAPLEPSNPLNPKPPGQKKKKKATNVAHLAKSQMSVEIEGLDFPSPQEANSKKEEAKVVQKQSMKPGWPGFKQPVSKEEAKRQPHRQSGAEKKIRKKRSKCKKGTVATESRAIKASYMK